MKLFDWTRFLGRMVVLCAVLSLLWAAQAQNPIPAADAIAIDFSYAGYGAGQALPQVRAQVRVAPSGKDDTAQIQQALDSLAERPMGRDGFRGAVVLEAGRFHVQGQLLMRASGVVLRGAGTGKTVVVAEGNSRRALIAVGGTKNPQTGAPIAVVDDAPAGSRELHLASIDGLKAGASVVVTRPSTAEWISAIGMTNLPGNFAAIRLDWKPGSRNLVWDRTIVAVNRENNSITLDAPITMALEKQWGGGTLARVQNEEPAERIGIENLTLDNSYDATNPSGEEHAWIAIQMDHLRDGWVRQVVARHFVSSAVRVNNRARRVTVLDCQSLEPMGEKAGYRRQSFVANGQQVLVARCLGEEGMNDFASGMLAAGPNVFLDCTARKTLGSSGAYESLAAGVLYEQVRVPEASIQLVQDFSRAQGAGWTAANSLIRNSAARTLDALGAPGAPNRVVESREPLFATQLKKRAGLSLEEILGRQLDTAAADAQAPLFHAPATTAQVDAAEPVKRVEIVGGRFVVDGRLAWGASQTEAWWKGDLSPWSAPSATGSSVTRFVPGVTAPGETEDLAEMVARLKKNGVLTIQVNPGLWYDRRRDSHTMERRSDADAWAPFYESPWARSGQGTAWDGLSRYDLSRYNPWYFARHRAFAQQAAKAGLVVFYDLYNTHNVLEIGPHWVDFPWRPANNINDTGLPEPPPQRFGGRNDLANEFFSTSNAPLRELHRAYILHTLDELGDQPNVIFGVAYQYAGPLSFEQFFLDTVAEWERRQGKHVRVALTTSKQITDAIMADAVRSRDVAVIDMRYWQYMPDGKLFAPEAGINRAFREQIMSAFPDYMDLPPATTEQQAYREIREYHGRYPQIALMPLVNGGGIVPVLMAGAAAPSALRARPSDEILATSAKTDCTPTTDAIPRDCAPPSAARSQASDAAVQRFVCKYLSGDLMRMEPQDGWTSDPETTWTLAKDSNGPVLIDSLGGSAIRVQRKLNIKSALWYNPRSGEEREAKAEPGETETIYGKPDAGEWLLLLQ
jgi:hypothetical protein